MGAAVTVCRTEPGDWDQVKYWRAAAREILSCCRRLLRHHAEWLVEERRAGILMQGRRGHAG